MNWADIEAEIYYLTPEEGGRHAPILSGYKGQFYYDGFDWDAVQQFIGKDQCELGDTVRALLQFTNLQRQQGQFYEGKIFFIREGRKIVGKGIIKKIFYEALNIWNIEAETEKLIKRISLAKSLGELQKKRGFVDAAISAFEQQSIFKSKGFDITDDLYSRVHIHLHIVRQPDDPLAVLRKIWKDSASMQHQISRIDGPAMSLVFLTWDEESFITGCIHVNT